MKNGNGLQIHVPVPERHVAQVRSQVFFRLAQKAVMKAQKERNKVNGDPADHKCLSQTEVDEICEKLRDELEKQGWFRKGAGIR